MFLFVFDFNVLTQNPSRVGGPGGSQEYPKRSSKIKKQQYNNKNGLGIDLPIIAYYCIFVGGSYRGLATLWSAWCLVCGQWYTAQRTKYRYMVQSA